MESIARQFVKVNAFIAREILSLYAKGTKFFLLIWKRWRPQCERVDCSQTYNETNNKIPADANLHQRGRVLSYLTSN